MLIDFVRNAGFHFDDCSSVDMSFDVMSISDSYLSIVQSPPFFAFCPPDDNESPPNKVESEARSELLIASVCLMKAFRDGRPESLSSSELKELPTRSKRTTGEAFRRLRLDLLFGMFPKDEGRLSSSKKID